METNCKNCVFAQYEDNTQTGCELNRINLFIVAGANVVDVYDEDREFFLIKDRVCNAHREYPWGKGMPIEDMKAQVLEEAKIKLRVFIKANPDNLDDLQTTIDSLVDQTVKPYEVVVLTLRDINKAQIIAMLRASGLKFALRHLVDESSFERAIDIAMIKCRSTFYAFFHSGFSVPGDFCEQIDAEVNCRLNQFVLLEPYDKEGNGTVVLTVAHHMCCGNEPAETTPEYGQSERCDTVEAKIKFMARQQDKLALIGKVEDVCPLE